MFDAKIEKLKNKENHAKKCDRSIPFIKSILELENVEKIK